jgi:hypothetical protein
VILSDLLYVHVRPDDRGFILREGSADERAAIE